MLFRSACLPPLGRLGRTWRPPSSKPCPLTSCCPCHPNAGTSKMNRKWIFLFLCALIICTCAFAQNQTGVNITDSDDMYVFPALRSSDSLVLSQMTRLIFPNHYRSFDEDPILKYRPDFSRSLPVQILITGIVLTLTSVLLLHLLFTAQYH